MKFCIGAIAFLLSADLASGRSTSTNIDSQHIVAVDSIGDLSMKGSEDFSMESSMVDAAMNSAGATVTLEAISAKVNSQAKLIDNLKNENELLVKLIENLRTEQHKAQAEGASPDHASCLVCKNKKMYYIAIDPKIITEWPESDGKKRIRNHCKDHGVEAKIFALTNPSKAPNELITDDATIQANEQKCNTTYTQKPVLTDI
eukprot:gnl/MRDRNA2_/MRDRNA2_136313_c0_seq1.p1 gnl/MRDRNA2_/MRDRNA2_136313_c0~~gnl/MRDRNA2_/MRDRNA2_136313_c0_seq1.p1  ORF type:complete len:202 (-),score=44.17 gnl/MRDRNA2_/MRDRNA2_136313_c0_seq1:193-798(-)